MATSGEGILALIEGTSLGKKQKGAGVSKFKSMTQVNISQGGEGFQKAVQQSTIFMVTLRQCRRYICDISVSRGTF